MLNSTIVALIVGTLLGFLAGLGVGGGSLLILWLTMVLSTEQAVARCINLMFFLPAAAISCLFRWKQGKLNPKITIPAVLAGCIASVLLTLLGRNLDSGFLRKGFGVLLLFTGFRELFYQPKSVNFCAVSGKTREKGGETMIQDDTIKLLRECDAGVKMGIASISDVLPHVTSEAFQNDLNRCMEEHEKLGDEIRQLLDKYQDDGKNPNPMAKTMSTVKTNMEMMMKPTDATIADLITDGCNMGVKSLSKYLNQYAAADENAKDCCKKLIALEEQLAKDLRGYL